MHAPRNDNQYVPQYLVVKIKKGFWGTMKQLIGVVILVLLAFVIWGAWFGGGLNDAHGLNKKMLSPLSLKEVSTSSGAKVAYVSLNGIILPDGDPETAGATGSITPGTVRGIFEDIKKDKDIRAVVIRINTPGGAAISSDDIAHQMIELKKTKPVYIYTDTLLASGGYYIAAQATKISSHKQAEIGSIGVIAELPNVSELLKQKLGVEMETYKTGAYKDMLSPFRSRTDEEKKKIAETLDVILNDFIDVIVKGRSLSRDRVKELATGEVWDARAALKNKLIDEVCYWDEYIDLLKRDLGIDEEMVFVSYAAPKSVLQEILSSARSNGLGISEGTVYNQLLAYVTHSSYTYLWYLYR